MTDETKKILYKWFNLKYDTYDKLERDGSIYLYYEGEEYAEIVIDKKREIIDYYIWSTFKEFWQIIPIKESEFENIMSEWVENTFGLKGYAPSVYSSIDSLPFKIPLI